MALGQFRCGARKFRCGAEEIKVVMNLLILPKEYHPKIHNSSRLGTSKLGVAPKVGEKGMGAKAASHLTPLFVSLL